MLLIKRRAISEEQKEERRRKILDVAQEFLEEHNQTLIPIAKIAKLAGIAKGTVYLYFQTKEGIFFSILEEHVQRWTERIEKAVSDSSEDVSLEELIISLYQYPLEHPSVLYLASIYSRVLDQNIPADRAYQYQRDIAEKAFKIGMRIERMFPTLQTGQGLQLLIGSYSLIIGFGQLKEPLANAQSVLKNEKYSFNIEFEKDLKRALTALWQGYLNQSSEMK